MSRPQEIDELLEALEIRYLGNRDPNLFFALLTDFRDAPEQTLPGDEALIAYARTAVEALNATYREDRPCIFYLFHRARQWNPVERVWLGYERKRGKLEQFNGCIRGGMQTAFSDIVGDVSILGSIRYVITLDTDTQLKTRDLISVITKVHSQTERGLRQYLTRALRNGCSAREVIDALLMAFPALGLAKIVWAADVILAMDLPEFHIDNLDSPPGWHDLLAANDAKNDEITYVDCKGRSLFIYRKGTDYRVYDSRCPHQVTNIPHLALEGKRLTVRSISGRSM